MTRRLETVSNGVACGLFAGVGGLELGLHAAGFHTHLLCEIEPAARTVLSANFPATVLEKDVVLLDRLPDAEVIAAGFPCQDLSMAGNKVGISGARSGLVVRLFDFLRQARERRRQPRWLLIENVPYMLHLDRGRAMREMVHELEALGFRWAYRIVDARSFGIPQRRRRVVLVASPTEDPRTVLFAGDHKETVDDSTSIVDRSIAYGFYWTEGKRGLGWGVDAVPTIKGGSTIGIPSPPAIWIPATGEVGTPDIRDLERLQGFPEGWTAAAETVLGRDGRNARWKLIGNAVNVEVSTWVAKQLIARDGPALEGRFLHSSERWPDAAWGEPGSTPRAVSLSAWPVAAERQPLRTFLRHPLKPLSRRATAGYLSRAAQATTLNFTPGFLEGVRMHERRMTALDTDVQEAA